MIRQFASVADFRAEFLRVCGTNVADTHGDASWYGGETLADSLRMSETGSTALVPAAEALLSELDSSIATPQRVWQRAPAGAYACVPEAIAGIPTPMRRPAYDASEHAPITVLAISTSSAGIKAQTLEQRGTTILALVMALARSRPVSLHSVSILDGKAGGETVWSIRINTAPLDLATACYTLTSAGFARRLNYRLAARLNGFRGSWPARFTYHNPAPYYDYLANTLAPDPSRTLVIGAAQLGDALLARPVEWINTQIARFVGQQEEEFAA
jgi:hypothetical protein